MSNSDLIEEIINDAILQRIVPRIDESDPELYREVLRAIKTGFRNMLMNPKIGPREALDAALDHLLDMQSNPELEELLLSEYDIIKHRYFDLLHGDALKSMRNSGLFTEIKEIGPSIIYKPGSKWLVKQSDKWEADQKAVIREIEESYKKNDMVVLPKKYKPSNWKIICSQLGDFRKDEIIEIAWDLDIGQYIRPSWSKAKICETLSKHMALLSKD